jgi:hypothetical protein
VGEETLSGLAEREKTRTSSRPFSAKCTFLIANALGVDGAETARMCVEVGGEMCGAEEEDLRDDLRGLPLARRTTGWEPERVMLPGARTDGGGGEVGPVTGGERGEERGKGIDLDGARVASLSSTLASAWGLRGKVDICRPGESLDERGEARGAGAGVGLS